VGGRGERRQKPLCMNFTPTWTTKTVPVCIQQISQTNNTGQPTTADNPHNLRDMGRTVLQSHTHGTSGLTSTKWGTQNSTKPQKSHNKTDYSSPVIFSAHAHTKKTVSFHDCEHMFLHLVHTITQRTRK